MINTDIADEALAEIRNEVGEGLVEEFGIDGAELNKLSTDSLVLLAQAVEGIKNEAWSLGYGIGAVEGGRGGVLADLSFDFDLAPEGTYAGIPLYTEKLAAENGQDSQLAEMVEADAVALDSVIQMVQKLTERVEFLEFTAGITYTG